MNKLAPLAFGILLLLSGALWYLADGSLNNYIKMQVQTAGSQLSEKTVTVGLVDMQTTQGNGHLENFTLSTTDSQQIIFNAKNIHLTVAVESLKTTPMVITELNISQPTLFLNHADKADLTQLSDVINANMAALSEKLQTSEKQLEPLIQIKRVVLTHAKVVKSSTENGQKEIVIEQIDLTPIVNDEGVSMSLAFADILEQSLTALSQQ